MVQQLHNTIYAFITFLNTETRLIEPNKLSHISLLDLSVDQKDK